MQADSSTDDDNSPPGHHYRLGLGRQAGGGSKPYGNARGGGPDYGGHLRQLQLDAYTAVMRAFRAQKDHIDWDQEDLLSGLRKSLQIAEETHREIGQAARKDEGLRKICEWVQRRGQHGGATPHYDATPGASSGPATEFGPASGGGRKKQKLGHSALPAPPTLQAPPPKERKAPPQQNLPGGRGGAASVKKGRGGAPPGRGRGGRPGSAAGPLMQPGAPIDKYVGMQVQTKWENDGWYEGLITDYNPVTGLHCLTYYFNTPQEEFEWINLAEMGPSMLKILGPASAAVMSLLGRGPAAKEVKRSGAASRGRGRGRGKAGFGRDAGPGRGEGGLEAAANGKRRERGDELEGGLMINLDNVDNLHEIDQAKLQLKQREEELRQQLEALGGSSGSDDENEGGEELAPMGPPPDPDHDSEEPQRRQQQHYARGAVHSEEEDEGEGEEEEEEEEDYEEEDPGRGGPPQRSQ